MSRFAIAAALALVAVLAGNGARAQKNPVPPPEDMPCTCPEGEGAETPPRAAPIRESAFADCRDARDNDGDGFVDCADQDCGIYAMCAAPRSTAAAPAQPPAPEETGKAYKTMRELKGDLRAKVISGRDFLRWQKVIRHWRKAEIERARADYRAGSINRGEYRARIGEIKAKYEG